MSKFYSVTHSKRNAKGKVIDLAFCSEQNAYMILNKDVWEKYQGSTKGIVPKLQVTSNFVPTPPKYDPIFPTIKEEALEVIPPNVLRELVKAYRTGDAVKVELTVTNTTIL